jgi:glycosyltransferase involved in cell wall biosynthesis
MKILLVHNHYQEVGGEDSMFESETTLLASKGHKVLRYTLSNDRIRRMNRFSLVGATLWNYSVYSEIRALIRKECPQVVHFCNTFPLISPSAYYAAKAEAVPVVQRLDNFRLLCSNALFLRNGRICEDCLGKLIPWPGVAHGCYRNSRTASSVVVAMLTLHRALRTWVRMVDVYIALTEFARQKFIQGGLPADKIVVLPNFVYNDAGPGEGRGGYAIFVGRLSPEKGVITLLAAWKHLAGKIPLKILGDGPMAPMVASAAQGSGSVEWLGRCPKDEVRARMGDALVLIFPSVWYEMFPLVAIEGFEAGLPVIASDHGSLRSLVDDGRTGLLFRTGDQDDLVVKSSWILSHPVELNRMRREARAEFEANYTAERHYARLMEIYERVVSSPPSRTED